MEAPTVRKPIGARASSSRTATPSRWTWLERMFFRFTMTRSPAQRTQSIISDRSTRLRLPPLHRLHFTQTIITRVAINFLLRNAIQRRQLEAFRFPLPPWSIVAAQRALHLLHNFREVSRSGVRQVQ